MSTRKIATALGAAVLLLGAPASYALAGQEDRPGKPEKVKECSDGIDNDQDGNIDFGSDADCGSANDNSESAPPAEEPGGETPDPAAELQAIVDAVLENLPSGPPEGGEPPALPAEVQAIVDEVLANLPSGPPEGGEPPAVPAELQAVIDEVVAQIPSGPPAPPEGVPAEVQAILDQLPPV